MDNKSFVSSEYFKKFQDECIKIPKKYKYIKHSVNEKKHKLRNFDSFHARKNMRKNGNSWKYFNLNI